MENWTEYPDLIDIKWKIKLDHLFKQLKSLDSVRNNIEEEIKELFKLNFQLKNFQKSLCPRKGWLYQTISKQLIQLERKMRHSQGEDFLSELYLLYSCLIDADKRAVSLQQPNLRKRMSIPIQIIEKYREKNLYHSSPISSLREDIYQEVTEKAKTFSLEQHIFTLTAPTGSGKTLSSIAFALRLRERIWKHYGYLPRIIYALPFTSIIDQTYYTFKNLLSLEPEFHKNPSSFLLKHHHLTEVEYTKDGEQIPLDEAIMLIEGWDSEIIVTTYWQLFHTICGNKNRHLKKFHSLSGAILILDEVQSLPMHYYGLFRQTFLWLVKKFQCYLIFMSATQPLFWDKEATEILSNPFHYFSKLNRTLWNIDMTPQSLSSFLEKLSKHFQKNRSYLLIFNTISASIQAYQYLSKAIKSCIPIYYLSSNILPKFRQKIVQNITQQLKQGCSLVLVSTQVVEAGVDLDFDYVYRDFAPLDSLVQAAGRSNREGRKNFGKVHIVRLHKEEKQSQFSSFIYSRVNLEVARELLEGKKQLEERELFELLHNHYLELISRKGKNQGISIYTDWMKKGNLDALQDFRLIEYLGPHYEVFISVDQEAERIWNTYLEKVYEEKNIRKRWQNYLAIRASLRKYLLSVPEKAISLHFWDYAKGDTRKIGYIPPEMVEDYYHLEWGYHRFREDEVAIFL